MGMWREQLSESTGMHQERQYGEDTRNFSKYLLKETRDVRFLIREHHFLLSAFTACRGTPNRFSAAIVGFSTVFESLFAILPNGKYVHTVLDAKGSQFPPRQRDENRIEETCSRGHTELGDVQRVRQRPVEHPILLPVTS
jgi:hypothetical protein